MVAGSRRASCVPCLYWYTRTPRCLYHTVALPFTLLNVINIAKHVIVTDENRFAVDSQCSLLNSPTTAPTNPLQMKALDLIWEGLLLPPQYPGVLLLPPRPPLHLLASQLALRTARYLCSAWAGFCLLWQECLPAARLSSVVL
jgi:hypothetical protein